jgi:hypothetical protein
VDFRSLTKKTDEVLFYKNVFADKHLITAFGGASPQGEALYF